MFVKIWIRGGDYRVDLIYFFVRGCVVNYLNDVYSGWIIC